jgi:L-ascorbate metabolism protein UlaG (beta-lactamase superfamily)
MRPAPLRITYIGGPTALIEIGKLRLLTDPTFDPAGGEYKTPSYSLFKLQGPVLDLATIGRIDAVLLSHDHHFDNLDNSGRGSLSKAPRVLTTEIGASRLGGHAEGLAPWQTIELEGVEGDVLSIQLRPRDTVLQTPIADPASVLWSERKALRRICSTCQATLCGTRV